jgi:hypothetical protein
MKPKPKYQPWHERLNDEYEAAGTDEERLTILERYMSHDQALDALCVIKTGATTGVRDL